MKPDEALLEAAAWPGGSQRSWVLPSALAAIVAIAAGPRAGMWQLAAWGVSPLGEAAKRLIGRPRPLIRRLNPFGRSSETPSFPSTHASNYIAMLGFATWILGRVRSRLTLPIGVVALVLVAAIGPSRIRTGDHRWSDVAAGYALGIAYLVGLVALARRDRALRRRGPRARSP